MQQKIRIGLIGVGRFGRLHLQVLRQLEEADVTAIADVDPEALRKAATQFGFDPSDCHTDPLALIERDDLDAVDIVSDESSHGRLIVYALRHGKHVIVEKPLAVSGAEAAAIGRAQAESGKQVLVGNISRFSHPYRVIKRAVDNGTLGSIAAIRSKRDFSSEWFHAFGNRIHPVYESGVHELDLIVWYAGSRCAEVTAFERRRVGYAYPDLFSAVLTFENGTVASLDSSWTVPASVPQNLTETLELDGTIDARIEVVGELGTAAYQLAHNGLTIYSSGGAQHPETTLWPTGQDGMIGGAILDELRHFVRMIQENHPSPVMPLEDSVHVTEIAEAIVHAAKYKKVVSLRRE